MHRDDVAAFLGEHHGAPVTDLEPLGGGHWSSAWGYRTTDGRELVVRFGELQEGFEADRAAMAYASPDLPVPDVLDIGDGWAISVRHRGRFLEDIRPDEAERGGPMVERLLGAMRAVPSRDVGSWHEWLRNGLQDDPDQTVSGWRARLTGEAERAFVDAAAEVDRLIDAGDIPERRDLIHGDLLHANVLVSDDASEVTAVFSWKCSTFGDWVFDLAWCTFWSAWHPGIAALDLWGRLGSREIERRHRCYELQIGASHLGWYAWTEDDANLQRVVHELRRRRP